MSASAASPGEATAARLMRVSSSPLWDILGELVVTSQVREGPCQPVEGGGGLLSCAMVPRLGMPWPPGCADSVAGTPAALAPALLGMAMPTAATGAPSPVQCAMSR